MKIKRFNELKSEIYKNGEFVKDKEFLDKLISDDKNNTVLNDPNSILDGHIYKWNTDTSNWVKMDGGNIQVCQFYINNDYLSDYGLDNDCLYLPLGMSFRLNLDPSDKSKIVGLGYNTVNKGDYYFENVWVEISYYIDPITNRINFGVYSFIEDNCYVFFLTRKGIRNLNKMISKFFKGEFKIKKLKWYGKSNSKLIQDEEYSLQELFYNYYDYYTEYMLSKDPNNESLKEISNNFDEHFHIWWDKLSEPNKIYYSLYLDDFPHAMKSIKYSN